MRFHEAYIEATGLEASSFTMSGRSLEAEEIGTQGAEVLSVRRAGESDCGTEEVDCVTGDAMGAISLALDLEAGRCAVVFDREEPTLATTPTYVVDVR